MIRCKYFAKDSNHYLKKCLTEQVSDSVERTGGRFLKPANKSKIGWISISRSQAQLKIAQSIQYRQRRLLGKNRKRNSIKKNNGKKSPANRVAQVTSNDISRSSFAAPPVEEVILRRFAPNTTALQNTRGLHGLAPLVISRREVSGNPEFELLHDLFDAGDLMFQTPPEEEEDVPPCPRQFEDAVCSLPTPMRPDLQQNITPTIGFRTYEVNNVSPVHDKEIKTVNHNVSASNNDALILRNNSNNFLTTMRAGSIGTPPRLPSPSHCFLPARVNKISDQKGSSNVDYWSAFACEDSGHTDIIRISTATASKRPQ